MSRKYLSLDEAAEQLGISTDELLRFREQGEVRGFADRGSWKFRDEDIEEFARSRQADSSPDFPIISRESASVLDDENDSLDLIPSDSDVRLTFDDALFTEEGSDDDINQLQDTGSDIRLSGDSGPQLEADAADGEISDRIELTSWDSNVVLADAGSGTKRPDSDSDVKLAGSDLDIDLLGEPEPGTDADIELGVVQESVSLGDSDSDVRLAEIPEVSDEAELDDDRTTGLFDEIDFDTLGAEDSSAVESASEEEAGEISPLTGDSDSDVRLSDESDEELEDDSSISFFDEIDSDSDVKLTGAEDLDGIDSDSDVTLGTDPDRTDSDIRLIDVPSGKAASTDDDDDFPGLFGGDSDLKLLDTGSSVRQPDSGIALPPGGSDILVKSEESGVSLEIDSGISLDADDSGISLESFDSGTSLSDDSGIAMEGFDSNLVLDDDSGISLDAADSGIALSFDDDSGISLDMDDEDDMSRTMPMQAVPGAHALMSDSNAMTTQVEGPRSGMDESEFELAGLDDDDDDAGTSTAVLDFEESEDDGGRTASKPARRSRAVAESDEEFSDEEYADEEEYDESMEGEDYADDFDDEEDEEGDGSGFAAPARGTYRSEADWGTPTKVMIGMGTLLSMLSAVIGVELVRTMWLWTQPGATKSSILEMIGGLFG